MLEDLTKPGATPQTMPEPAGQPTNPEPAPTTQDNEDALTETQRTFFQEARTAFESRDESIIKSFMETADWEAVFDSDTQLDEYGNIYGGNDMWAAKRYFDTGELTYHVGMLNDTRNDWGWIGEERKANVHFGE